MKIGWLLSGPMQVAGPRMHGWNMHACLLKKEISSEIVYVAEHGKALSLSHKKITDILENSFDVLVLVGFSSLTDADDLIKKAHTKKVKVVYVKTDDILSDFVRACDATIVVSEFSKEDLPKEVQKKVFVIFDGYENDRNVFKQHTNEKNIKLVFVSNNVFNKFPQLTHLPENVSLKIIGPPQRRVEKYSPGKKMFTETTFPFEYVLWDINTVHKEILDCDVAIIPYPEEHIHHEYVKRKSSNRLIMFMSLGIPTITSPIDIYMKLLSDGKTGFIARTPQEWITHIEYLRDHPEERKKIGFLARTTVVDTFSKEKQAEEYLKVFHNVVMNS